ncbi:DUF2887 domain-containing protein [Nostoc sp. CALU 1950]|uniref:DUF2887 domain-containing protein n=1 Tax=Nostoc sp. CALU 1950 TaxID=3104321 RepID=UPI003EB77363
MPLVASIKTDVIFYELIKELAQIFFELINKLDTNPNIYTFIAPEVKQKSFCLDGLFTTIKAFKNEPLYFVELQTYKDEDFTNDFLGKFLFTFVNRNQQTQTGTQLLSTIAAFMKPHLTHAIRL